MMICVFDKEINSADNAFLTSIGNVVLCNESNESNYSEEVFNSDVLIVYSVRATISQNVIDRLTNCYAIIRPAVGYDNIDIKAAGSKGIFVFNVPDYGTSDVADHTIALFLSYIKRINTLNKNVHIKIWDPEPNKMHHRLSTLKFGIIGLGRIGGAVAFRLRAFGINVLFYDPYKEDGYDQVFHATRMDSLEELISTCDVVSIHTPLTEETRYMITTDLLSHSNRNLIVINCARGKIISNETIVNSLKNNYVSAFLLDTIEFEPFEKNDPILEIIGNKDYDDRIIITPHAASYDVESRRDMHSKGNAIVKLIVENKEIRNCVNKEFLKNPRKNLQII